MKNNIMVENLLKRFFFFWKKHYNCISIQNSIWQQTKFCRHNKLFNNYLIHDHWVYKMHYILYNFFSYSVKYYQQYVLLRSPTVKSIAIKEKATKRKILSVLLVFISLIPFLTRVQYILFTFEFFFWVYICYENQQAFCQQFRGIPVIFHKIMHNSWKIIWLLLNQIWWYT